MNREEQLKEAIAEVFTRHRFTSPSKDNIYFKSGIETALTQASILRHADPEIMKAAGWVREVKTKEFSLKRMSNGAGHSNLLAIIKKGIEDIEIGDAIIVPYPQGYVDPIKAILQVDDNEYPIRIDGRFAKVVSFIYE